jgi:hypothetical protein
VLLQVQKRAFRGSPLPPLKLHDASVQKTARAEMQEEKKHSLPAQWSDGVNSAKDAVQ